MYVPTLVNSNSIASKKAGSVTILIVIVVIAAEVARE